MNQNFLDPKIQEYRNVLVSGLNLLWVPLEQGE